VWGYPQIEVNYQVVTVLRLPGHSLASTTTNTTTTATRAPTTTTTTAILLARESSRTLGPSTTARAPESRNVNTGVYRCLLYMTRTVMSTDSSVPVREPAVRAVRTRRTKRGSETSAWLPKPIVNAVPNGWETHMRLYAQQMALLRSMTVHNCELKGVSSAMQPATDSTPASLRDRLKVRYCDLCRPVIALIQSTSQYMRRGSAALDAILCAPGGTALHPLSCVRSPLPSALVRPLDIAATPEKDVQDPNFDDNAIILATRFSATPLRHEDVSVALDNDSGSSSSRRASLITAQNLAMPLFSSSRVIVGAQNAHFICYLPYLF
jgi:hypothetical protein